MFSALRYIIYFGICAIFVFSFFYILIRFNIKKEFSQSPFDNIPEGTCAYSYGLKLTNSNNCIGSVKLKALAFYPSGKIKAEYLYASNGLISQYIFYYENGNPRATCPVSSNKYGIMKDDGLQKTYYENGTLEYEGGSRPGGDGHFSHGISRQYSSSGKLISEKYFINDNECTKGEWKEWLKKHPEDIKYSGKIKD